METEKIKEQENNLKNIFEWIMNDDGIIIFGENLEEKNDNGG